MGEFLGFATEALGAEADLAALGNEWRLANDRIRELEQSEAGLADEPSLDEPEGALAEQVRDHPVVRRSFSVVPYSIRVVELDRLVVFQKHINIDYAERLKASVVDRTDPAAVYAMAFPLGRDLARVSRARVAQNAFAFVSPSTDIRLLDAVVLEPEQVTGYQPSGFPAGIVALVVGLGSNLLSAIHVENRLVLNNGSHRAYALRDLGLTRVPCLVQHVSRREELNVIASSELAERTDLYLKAPRPPLLKDYFDPLLRKELDVPGKVRQVKIAFAAESLDVPRQ